MKTRTRLASLFLLIVLAMSGALPAMAVIVEGNTCQGCSGNWDPALQGCPDGQEWKISSYTYNYGSLDSTGTTKLTLWTTDGVAHSVSRTGEHDLVNYVWKTPYKFTTRVRSYYTGLSSFGRFKLTISCAA